MHSARLRAVEKQTPSGPNGLILQWMWATQTWCPPFAPPGKCLRKYPLVASLSSCSPLSSWRSILKWSCFCCQLTLSCKNKQNLNLKIHGPWSENSGVLSNHSLTLQILKDGLQNPSSMTQLSCWVFNHQHQGLEEKRYNLAIIGCSIFNALRVMSQTTIVWLFSCYLERNVNQCILNRVTVMVRVRVRVRVRIRG